MDLYFRTTLRKLLPEAMDGDLDRIRGDIAGRSKNVVFDQSLRDNAILGDASKVRAASFRWLIGLAVRRR